MTPGSIRGVRKKSACRPTAAPGSLGRISRPFYLRSHANHRASLLRSRPRSLSIRRGSCNHRHPLHQPPLSTQGHPNAFPPPTTDRSLPRRATALPPMASPAQQRQPSTTQPKGMIGPFAYIRRNARTHTKGFARARSKIIEKILGESGVAGVSPWRRCRRYHRPRPSRSTVIFFPFPPGVENICDSLSLFRVCVVTLHATFSAQLVGK